MSTSLLNAFSSHVGDLHWAWQVVLIIGISLWIFLLVWFSWPWVLRSHTIGMKRTFETAEQFEAWYAHNSGVSVEWLHKMGRYGKLCDCGEEDCTGWQMAICMKDSIWRRGE